MIAQPSNFSLISTLRGKHILFLIFAFLLILIIPHYYGAESGSNISSNLEESEKLDSADGITPKLSSIEPPSSGLNVLNQHVDKDITLSSATHGIEIFYLNDDYGDLYRGADISVSGRLGGTADTGGWDREFVQLYISHDDNTPWKDENQFDSSFDPLDYEQDPNVYVQSSTQSDDNGMYTVYIANSLSDTGVLSKPGKFNFFLYFFGNPDISGRTGGTVNNGTFEIFGAVMIDDIYIGGNPPQKTLPQNEISVRFSYAYDNGDLRDETGRFDVSLNYLWNETINGATVLNNDTRDETVDFRAGEPNPLRVVFPARPDDIGSDVNTLHVIVTIRYSIDDSSGYFIAVHDQRQRDPENFDQLIASEERDIFNGISFGVYWYNNTGKGIIGNSSADGYDHTILDYRNSTTWLYLEASSENENYNFTGRTFGVYINRSEDESYFFKVPINESGTDGSVSVLYEVTNILFDNSNFSIEDIRLPFSVHGSINATEWELGINATREPDYLRYVMIANISSFSANLTDRPNLYYYSDDESSENITIVFKALDELNNSLFDSRVMFSYQNSSNHTILDPSNLTLSESLFNSSDSTFSYNFSMPSGFNPNDRFFYINFTILEEGMRDEPSTMFLYENSTDSSVNGPISVQVFVYNIVTLTLGDLDVGDLDIPPSNNLWFNNSYREAAMSNNYTIVDVLGDHERNSTTLEGVKLAFVFYIGDTFEIVHEIVLNDTTVEELLVWSPYDDSVSGGINAFDNNLAHSDLSVRIRAYTYSGGLISDQLASINFSTYGPDTHTPSVSDLSITPDNATIPHDSINITASLSDDDDEFTGVSRVVIVFNHTDAANSSFKITTLELTGENSSNFIVTDDNDVNLTISLNITEFLSASPGDYVTVYLYVYDYAGFGHNVSSNSRFNTAEYNESVGNLGISEILSFRVGDYAPPVATRVIIIQDDETIFPIPEIDDDGTVPVAERFGIVSNKPVEFYIDVEDNIVTTGVEYASLSYMILDSNNEVVEMNTVNLTLVNSDSFGLVWYYQFPGLGYLQDFSFEIVSVDNSSSFNKGTTPFSVFLFGLDPLPPEIVDIDWILNAPIDSDDPSSFPTNGTELFANQTIDFTILVKDDQSDVRAIEITINRYDENENIIETESVMLSESELVSGERVFTYLTTPNNQEGVISYTITAIDLAGNTISSSELSFAVVSIPIPIPNTEGAVPEESNLGILIFLSFLIILFVGFIIAATVYLVYSVRSAEEENLPLTTKIEHYRLDMEKYLALEMYPEALALVPFVINEVAREKHSLQRKEAETILEFNEAILKTGAYRRHLLSTLMRGWQTLKYAEHKIDRELVDDVLGAVLNIEEQIKGNDNTSI